MLVARTNAGGLLAAQAAIRQWASGAVAPIELYGLVLIADMPGALPKPLKDLKRHISGGVQVVYEISFDPNMRVGETERISTNLHQIRILEMLVSQINQRSI